MRFWEETNKVREGQKRAGPFATGSGSPETLNNSVKILCVFLCISDEDGHLVVMASLTRLLKTWTFQHVRICWATFASNMEITCCKRFVPISLRNLRRGLIHSTIQLRPRPGQPSKSIATFWWYLMSMEPGKDNNDFKDSFVGTRSRLA